MLWIRHRLGLVASVWLAFQFCLLVVTPTALCPSATAAAGVECACKHSDGQICPMHRAASSLKASTKDQPSCACRSTTDPATAMVASLIGPAGVLTPLTLSVSRNTIAVALPAFAPAPLDRSFVPDSPPPRA